MRKFGWINGTMFVTKNAQQILLKFGVDLEHCLEEHIGYLIYLFLFRAGGLSGKT